jgi:hypothetical protein
MLVCQESRWAGVIRAPPNQSLVCPESYRLLTDGATRLLEINVDKGCQGR